MSRYCTNCGAELPEGARFCINCGEEVVSKGAPDEVVRDPARAFSDPSSSVGTLNRSAIRRSAGAAAALLAFLLFLVALAFIGSATGIVGLLVGLVLATLPVPIYAALALWIDRFEKEPLSMLVITFVWGATVAVTISLVVNTLVSSVAGPNASTVISAPVVEEVSKGLALFILFFWKRDEFDNVIDGVVYAAMVALGFAWVENILYYGRAFMAEGIGGGLEVFVLRGVALPYMHPIWTSMTGIGLGLARQYNRSSIKIVAPVAGLLAAMILHSLWNGLSPYFFFLFVFVGILAFVACGLRREGRLVSKHLSPELQSGLLSREEYDSLSTVSGRLGASLRALSVSHGLDKWRAHSQFHQSASELAFYRDRLARGVVPRDSFAAQREAAYIEHLREAKDALEM